MKRSIITILAIFVTCGAVNVVTAEEAAPARGNVMVRLGKAINRAFVAKPRDRSNFLQPVNRVHYATDVYKNEGVATSKDEVVSSHGLFIHIDLDDVKPKVKMGHVLAE